MFDGARLARVVFLNLRIHPPSFLALSAAVDLAKIALAVDSTAEYELVGWNPASSFDLLLIRRDGDGTNGGIGLDFPELTVLGI